MARSRGYFYYTGNRIFPPHGPFQGFVIMPMDHTFSDLISQDGVFTFQSFTILPAWLAEDGKVLPE